MSSVPPQQFRLKNSKTVLLRTAIPDDAAALLEYIDGVLLPNEFFVTQRDEFEVSAEQERTWLQQHLDAPNGLVLIAEIDGELVGLLDFESGHRRRISHRGVLSVTVRSDLRGEGVGSVLLRTLIGWAESNPRVEKLTLAVMATNELAIKLYKRFGFSEEGRRVKEVKLGPGQYVDDILMCRFVDSASNFGS